MQVFCIHICLYTVYMPGTHGNQKRASDPQEAMIAGAGTPVF